MAIRSTPRSGNFSHGYALIALAIAVPVLLAGCVNQASCSRSDLGDLAVRSLVLQDDELQEGEDLHFAADVVNSGPADVSEIKIGAGIVYHGSEPDMRDFVDQVSRPPLAPQDSHSQSLTYSPSYGEGDYTLTYVASGWSEVSEGCSGGLGTRVRGERTAFFSVNEG